MRINVYSQELTSEVNTVLKGSNTGVTYSAVQLMLHSSPLLHHPPADDDRSAVTFWLPKSADRREQFAQALEHMARLVRAAPKETGLD
jgi:Flp pilus assembly protein TadD